MKNTARAAGFDGELPFAHSASNHSLPRRLVLKFRVVSTVPWMTRPPLLSASLELLVLSVRYPDRQRSLPSEAVAHTIERPVLVTPRAPAGEQNDPGFTVAEGGRGAAVVGARGAVVGAGADGVPPAGVLVSPLHVAGDHNPRPLALASAWAALN